MKDEIALWRWEDRLLKHKMHVNIENKIICKFLFHFKYDFALLGIYNSLDVDFVFEELGELIFSCLGWKELLYLKQLAITAVQNASPGFQTK